VVGFLRVSLPHATTDMRAAPDRLDGLSNQRAWLFPPLAQAASTHYIDQYLSITVKKLSYPAWACRQRRQERVVSRWQCPRCQGTRLTRSRRLGLSNGSCASSVCTPFAAIGVGIGSGASAAAGARTLGASRPWPEGPHPLLVLSSSPAAAGVLGSVVDLGRHGEGVFDVVSRGGQPSSRMRDRRMGVGRSCDGSGDGS
jgi:hypothetical protein